MLKEAFTFEKLLTAHKRCRRSKQHKTETISFEINLSATLVELSKRLLNMTYKPGKYKEFKIFEPKERTIEALSYKDRVVLMALCSNIIEPKVEKYLIFDNVACRKNKGTLFGIKRLEGFLHDYYRKFGHKGYFLKCDIKKYFQSIDHNMLIEKLKKTDLDNEDLLIIKTIIDSKNADSGVGLPIGNQTSQWFGLFYLNTIDRLIKEKLQIKYYVRYMDDMILIHHDKEYLKFCKKEIQRCAENELHLKLNSKTQIGTLQNGIDFLGFHHTLCETGKVKRFLRGQAKLRTRRKVKHLAQLKNSKLITKDKLNQRLNALKAHVIHSNAKKFYLNLTYKYHLPS